MKRTWWLFILFLSVWAYAYAGGSARGSGFNEGVLEMSDYPILFDESQEDPGIPLSDKIQLYAKDKEGTTTLYTQDASGTVTEIGAGGGSMVYPDAGIAVSTGDAWGTSLTDSSANWDTAYGWGNHADAGYLTSEVDGSTTNELQDLSLLENTLSLSDSLATVDLSGYLDNTDSQAISVDANILSITGSVGTVDLSGYLDNTDDQTCAEVSGCVEGALTAETDPNAVLLAGRAGGQTIKGGTAEGDDLSFWTNSTGVMGSYFFTDLTDNGFVKTSGGTGLLSIDTTEYLSSVTADSPLSGSGTSGSHLSVTDGAISSAKINWTDINALAPIQTGGINWDSITNAELQTASVNWDSVINSEIQSSGVNWTSLSEDISSSGVNWDSVVNAELFSSGVNWSDVNSSSPITSGGFNWASISGYNVSSTQSLKNSEGSIGFVDESSSGWTDGGTYLHPTTTTDSVIIGEGTAVGTSGTKVLALNIGTAPSSSPADMVQLYAEDSAGDATGGTITHVGGKTIHTFLLADSGTDFTVPNGLTSVDYLVVGGGGGGGSPEGGGGGGGGFRTGTLTVTAQAYEITVGAGGSAGSSSKGGDGGNSVFSTITATGGGGGGRGGDTAGRNGGSGGGGTYNGGAGGDSDYLSPKQGYDGGTGSTATSHSSGGGGGAGEVGANGVNGVGGGDGGDGMASSISGTSVTYAGGGGGASETVDAGSGGAGGGGDGGKSPDTPAAEAGTANTGGGGGGGYPTAGAGGSGIVIISYPTIGVKAELKVRDEAGNATTLSPHNFSNIPKDVVTKNAIDSDGLAWTYHSEKDGKSITVDMFKSIQFLEKLMGEKLIYTSGADIKNDEKTMAELVAPIAKMEIEKEKAKTTKVGDL